MSEIRIERTHALGLPRARHVAHEWMAQARDRWGLQFEYQPCDAAEADAQPAAAVDRIRFSGMGADGHAQVSASRFTVELALGGLLAALGPIVEDKMARKLDELLAQEAQSAAR